MRVAACRAGAFAAALLGCALLIPAVCAAQARARRAALPRVGTIKDYPATGLTVGCGNYYTHLLRDARSPGAAYVFLARSDGSHAWMNLDGRDVRLRQIRSARRRGGDRRLFNYRRGALRVTVAFEEFAPGDEFAGGDFLFKLKITLRRGRASRTVRAVGYADC
jgi:hypothetical protein